MAIFIACTLVWVGQGALAEPAHKAVLTVKTSLDSELETNLELTNNFERFLKHGQRKSVQNIPVLDTYLTLNRNGEHLTFLVDQAGNLYDEKTLEIIYLQEHIKSELRNYVHSLRSKHYGQMIEWDNASTLIPKQAKFKVIDLETGLSFNVQRRAGSKHADVQPLTKEDTAIMKQIYNGAWSWRRKAIIVQTEDQRLAASMHGMPHGGDGIPDNDFSGHFCIHFTGSSTHGSGNVDPEHQLMVYKAAGKLVDYFNEASPYQIADAFLIALNLKEPQILKMSFADAKDPQLDYFLKEKDRLKGIRKRSSHVDKPFSGVLALEFPLEVNMYRENNRVDKATFTFQMIRGSLLEPWTITSISMVS